MSITREKHSLLVIGGTGFIGQHLVKAGIDKQYIVTVLSSKLPKEEKLPPVEYLTADLANKSELEELFKGRAFNYVVNLGGYIDHSSYHEGGREVIEVHFTGLLNIISILNKKKLIHFIQIGSSDEYGDNNSPQHEKLTDLPFSCYSFAKSSATRILKMLHEKEKFPVTILRLFLVYGPGQATSRFLPNIISSCLNGEAVETTAGNQIRDFCFIEDIVEGIMKALSSKVSHGQVINLASGEPVQIKEVVNLVAELTNSEKPKLGMLPYREGENMSLYADIKKAQQILGWKPKVDLHKGISITIDHCKKSF